MEQNETYSQKPEISVFDVLNKLVEKWYVVAISVVLFVATAFVYVNFFCTPMYSSTAKLFIFNTENNIQNTSEVTISTYLARDYAELIVDRTVLESVIDNLDLKYSYNALKGAVSVNNPDGTRILEIKVKTKNPKQSKKIADEICRVSQEKIVDLMGIGRVNIISKGHVPSSPSYPNKGQFILTAFAASLVFSSLIIFLMLITSDKIDSEDDIQRYLELSVLATIPYANTSAKKKTVKSKRKKAK